MFLCLAWLIWWLLCPIHRRNRLIHYGHRLMNYWYLLMHHRHPLIHHGHPLMHHGHLSMHHRKPWFFLPSTAKWEPDQHSSKFISLNWNLPPGALLCATLLGSVLRQHIQTLHHLNAEPDFVVDFCLPFPVASSQPLLMLDGRWELGTTIQAAIVKISG